MSAAVAGDKAAAAVIAKPDTRDANLLAIKKSSLKINSKSNVTI
jgi:hypothetical protein